jgi:hypothetical protein
MGLQPTLICWISLGFYVCHVVISGTALIKAIAIDVRPSVNNVVSATEDFIISSIAVDRVNSSERQNLVVAFTSLNKVPVRRPAHLAVAATGPSYRCRHPNRSLSHDLSAVRDDSFSYGSLLTEAAVDHPLAGC